MNSIVAIELTGTLIGEQICRIHTSPEQQQQEKSLGKIDPQKGSKSTR